MPRTCSRRRFSAFLAGWPSAGQVAVAEIDPELADTAAFCRATGCSPDASANCVVVAGKRAGEVKYAACMVLATDRADVNGAVRRLLDVRKASFAPMDGGGRADRDGVRRHHPDRAARRLAGAGVGRGGRGAGRW